MKNELPPDAPDGFRTMTPDQVTAAVALSEKTLQDFADDSFDWPTSETAHNSLQRAVVQDADTLIGSRITILDDGKLDIKRYLLLIPTGAFILLPELIDPDNPVSVDEDPSENPDVMEMMYNLGHHLADDDDWDDFILLMEQGREFHETLRSLEEKLGVSLGGKAVTSIDWENIPIDDLNL